MTNIYHNSTDEAIVNSIISYKEQAAEIGSHVKIATNALLERKSTEIQVALSQKAEPFGAVSQKIGNQKVTFTTPKNVEWDQEGLKQLFEQIKNDGGDPTEYITVEYKVKEDAYKNWPSNLKEYFEPHRTVKAGNVSVKIEPAKDA